jgi:serine/threonine-protein kinase
MPAPEKPAERRPEEEDLSGRELGDFRLIRRLGRGAMAAVYLAEQPSLGRQVAVKVLRGDLANDDTYVRRFQREAQAAASLVHGNIVQIYEVGHVEGIYYIAQEYVHGLNLRQWIARNGTLDLKTALVVMRQAAAALAKAADEGIVHRDIKPENIMLTRSGEVKVADFGLARVSGGTDATDLTQVGMTMGTPLYMSPEQVEGKTLDPRSDLYSLGVTCYHMLAGSPPFGGETALSVAVQHLKTQPEPLETLRPDLPPALCRAVHRMLQKSPAKRYPSARELLRDLRRVQAEHLQDADWPDDLLASGLSDLPAAGPDTAGSDATQRLQNLMETVALRRTRRPRAWTWIAAVVLAFVVGGAIAYFATVDRFLLASAPQTGQSVPREETIARQWLYANRVGTKVAWQAVLDYFPETPQSKSYQNSARQQLARICLAEGNDEAALEICEFLAAPGNEPELRAWGLAGKCCILSRQGKYEESAATYGEYWPLHSELKDPMIERLVEHAQETNKAALSPQLDPDRLDE